MIWHSRAHTISLKTPRQIDGIRKSARILSTVLREVVDAIKPGITTATLDKIAAKTIQKLGAKSSFLRYQGYPSVLCASVDNVVIHGIPNREMLRSGQIVGIDCGVNWRGYYSDAAITVPVEKISAEAQSLLETSKKKPCGRHKSGGCRQANRGYLSGHLQNGE